MNGVDPASDRNILSSERTGLSPMAWALLGIAGILEIAFAYWMKSSEGFSRLMPALLTVVTGVSSVFLLSLALYTARGDWLCGMDRYRRSRHRNSGNGGTGRFRGADEGALYRLHFGGRHRTQGGIWKLRMIADRGEASG